MSSTLLRHRRRLGKKGQKQRSAIIDISKHVIYNEGVDSLVMRQIAAKAEMELGNLQYYFPTRDDLLEAIVRDVFEKDTSTISNSEIDHDIEKTIGELLDSWTGHGLVYGLIFAATYRSPRFTQLKALVYETFYNHMSTLIEEKNPGLSDSERLRRAKLITALLDGTSAQYHAGSKRQIANLERGLKADVVELAVQIAMR